MQDQDALSTEDLLDLRPGIGPCRPRCSPNSWTGWYARLIELLLGAGLVKDLPRFGGMGGWNSLLPAYSDGVPMPLSSSAWRTAGSSTSTRPSSPLPGTCDTSWWAVRAVTSS